MVAFETRTDDFRREELVGSYVLNVGPGTDKLELRSDGTYIHTRQGSNATRSEDHDKWELDNMNGSQQLSLDNINLDNNEALSGEKAKRRGYYLLKPTRFFGSIHLERDPDLNVFYKKE